MQIFFCNSTDFFFNLVKSLTSKIIAKISKEMRMKIVKMSKNISQRAIAKKLGISRSCISEILSKFQDSRSVSDRSRCSRPRKLQHRMVRKLKAKPKKTAEQVMDEGDLSNLVSVDTI